MKKILKASFSLLLAFCIAATLGGCSGSKQEMNKTQIQQFTTEGSTFKVAVISDTQLPPTEKQLKESDTYVKNLEKALTVIKNNNVDMIIFAGDIGDLGTRFAFQTYMDVFDSVFGNDKPISFFFCCLFAARVLRISRATLAKVGYRFEAAKNGVC